MRYNVAGGGDSALYGTESATFYLRNGVLNLNMALPLALTAPLLPALWAFSKTGASHCSGPASQFYMDMCFFN